MSTPTTWPLRVILNVLTERSSKTEVYLKMFSYIFKYTVLKVNSSNSSMAKKFLKPELILKQLAGGKKCELYQHYSRQIPKCI